MPKGFPLGHKTCFSTQKHFLVEGMAVLGISLPIRQVCVDVVFTVAPRPEIKSRSGAECEIVKREAPYAGGVRCRNAPVEQEMMSIYRCLTGK